MYRFHVFCHCKFCCTFQITITTHAIHIKIVRFLMYHHGGIKILSYSKFMVTIYTGEYSFKGNMNTGDIFLFVFLICFILKLFYLFYSICNL